MKRSKTIDVLGKKEAETVCVHQINPNNNQLRTKGENKDMRKSIISILILLAVALGATGAMAAEKSPAGVVNINTADASQIAYMPRIGPKTAERVVQFREDHGAFKHPTDLMQVKGIGAKTFELIAPYVVVDGKTTLSSKQRTPKTEKPSNTALK